jgi:hypothetical protein
MNAAQIAAAIRKVAPEAAISIHTLEQRSTNPLIDETPNHVVATLGKRSVAQSFSVSRHAQGWWTIDNDGPVLDRWSTLDRYVQRLIDCEGL